MADQRTNPNSDRPATTDAPQPGPTPGGAPRAAVPGAGEGYPAVDTGAFDPEGQDWLSRARRWIEQNPGLAIAGAAAAGLLIGRAIAAAIPEPEPETLTEALQRRARELAEHGREVAGDTREVISKQLAIAADALAEASRALGKGTQRGYAEAKEFGEFVADSFGKAAAERLSRWLETR